MSDDDRTTKRVLAALLLAWVGVFAYAFWQFHATQPTGDGFVRGLNRVTGFLGWQALAAAIAVAAFVKGRRLPHGDTLRAVSMLPLILLVLGLLGIVGVVLWAILAHP